MARDPKPAAKDLDDAALAKIWRDELNEVTAEAGVDAIEAPNPALAPVPDTTQGAKTYTVVGPNVVHDTPPGGDFTRDLKPEQEALLIESGHIIVKQQQED
jgi:hypothetical protein